MGESCRHERLRLYQAYALLRWKQCARERNQRGFEGHASRNASRRCCRGVCRYDLQVRQGVLRHYHREDDRHRKRQLYSHAAHWRGRCGEGCLCWQHGSAQRRCKRICLQCFGRTYISTQTHKKRIACSAPDCSLYNMYRARRQAERLQVSR